MSAKERTDLINKLYKFVKKDCQLITPPSDRTVMEHMLYACCLENSTDEAADEAFARLQESYYDWNEIRVTTVVELAEQMKSLTDPQQSAVQLKKTLHGIFETYYKFEIEFLKKENLSKAIAQFEQLKGMSPFVISYVAQQGLGGHSIPLDRAVMLLFFTLGIATEADVAKGRVPGLERTISKAKGIEFSSLVHQLAVTFYKSPFNVKTREKLLKINKDAKERFPKRPSRKKAEPAKEKKRTETAGKEKTATSKSKTAASKSKTTASKPAKKATLKKAAVKKAVKKKATKKAAATQKTTAKKKVTKKATATKAKKKLPAKKKSASKGSTTKRLAKKKPR